MEPDGHSSQPVSTDDLADYYREWPEEYCPKVGYFGSLSAQKGQRVIEELVRVCDKASFHLFTLNDVDIESSNLVEKGKLSYAESLGKMKEMDFLLLTIELQDNQRDISAFTSPLKLFEYSASGRVILASDVPVLREVVTDAEVVFCANSASEFCEAIQRMSQDLPRRVAMSRALLAFSERFTWLGRAERILEKLVPSNQNHAVS